MLANHLMVSTSGVIEAERPVFKPEADMNEDIYGFPQVKLKTGFFRFNFPSGDIFPYDPLAFQDKVRPKCHGRRLEAR
jgi:hypothetical protein